jgi:hypothetical protein
VRQDVVAKEVVAKKRWLIDLGWVKRKEELLKVERRDFKGLGSSLSSPRL